MPQQLAVIFNPMAHGGRAVEHLDEIRWRLRAAGCVPELFPTSARHDAERFARDLAAAAVHDAVLVAGGDGTIHEVVNGLAGTAMPLGFLPIGTGNDFIKMLQLTRDLHQATSRAVAGGERRVDVGRVNERVFANGVGIGFDAAVAVAAQDITVLSGMSVYIAGMLRALMTFKPPEMRVEVDDAVFEGNWSMVTIGNGAYHGGGFWITPQAEIDDGLLDICLVQAMPRPTMLWHFPKVVQGTHARMQQVRILRGRRIRITAPGGAPVHVDGEIFGAHIHELAIQVDPGALRVRI